jgi:hypothetical protein
MAFSVRSTCRPRSPGRVTVIYVIIDVEYPRTGRIRLGTFDQLLIDVRAGMD